MNRRSADNAISEQQDHGAPKPLSMFSLNLDKRRADFEAENGKGIEHEFQAIGKELEPIFGKRIWAVFHTPKGTEANVRRAYEICKKRGKVSYDYFRGVLKNL
jgi:DNA replication protein DnaD